MASEVDRRAARILAGLAATEVRRAAGGETARSPLRWLTRGRRVRRRDWSDDPESDAPWRDTRSANRPGWRERAAYLDANEVFAVDYEVCRRCGLGWVEEPYTHPDYQRCGLAAAALAALRTIIQDWNGTPSAAISATLNPSGRRLARTSMAATPSGTSALIGLLANAQHEPLHRRNRVPVLTVSAISFSSTTRPQLQSICPVLSISGF